MLSLSRHTLKYGGRATAVIKAVAFTFPHSFVVQRILFPLGKGIKLIPLDVSTPLLSSSSPSSSSGLTLFSVVTVACETPKQQQYRYFSSDSHNKMENKTEKIPIDKEELRKRLTPMQYQVTQEAATERPFTGCYNKHYEKGIYQCIVCHQDLFSSETKYDSGCGWPAFNDVLDKGKITLHRDASIPGMVRTEVRCSKCSAHMGHVFDDGPAPKYQRYCINSASIDFVPYKPPSASIASAPAPAAAPASSSANKASSAPGLKNNTANNVSTKSQNSNSNSTTNNSNNTTTTTKNQAGNTLKSNGSNQQKK